MDPIDPIWPDDDEDDWPSAKELESLPEGVESTPLCDVSFNDRLYMHVRLNTDGTISILTETEVTVEVLRNYPNGKGFVRLRLKEITE